MGGREVSIERDYPVVDGLKFDATDDQDGRPWDVKGSMTNGVRPTFKFWMDQHDTLSEHDGGYVLVWYRASGTEIRVVASRTVRARDLEITTGPIPATLITEATVKKRKYRLTNYGHKDQQKNRGVVGQWLF